MTDRMRTALEQACQMFMYPIAKFLLSRGFRYPDFAEIAKLAFVQAAQDSQNKNTRIASLVGITRKEVASLAGTKALDANALFYARRRPSEVLGAWHQSSRYLDENGRPRPLSLSEFNELVAVTDPDWDPADCLRLLEEVGAVSRTPTSEIRAEERYYVPPTTEPSAIFHFGLRLRDLAFTLGRNLDDGRTKVIEAASYSSLLKRSELPTVRRVARRQGLTMLEAFDDWLAAQSNFVATDDGEGVRTAFSVCYYEDPVAAPTSEQP